MDFNLDGDNPYINKEIDLILQQVDILFSTVKREVLDDEDYGTQYDHYLYNLRISNTALESEVLSDLYSLNLFGYTPTVKVYLMQGTEQDIALIEITLSKNDEEYKKTYKIS